MAPRKSALDLAQAAEKKGSLDKAIAAYREHLGKAPDDLRSRLRLAELEERVGHVAAAAAEFEQVGETYAKQGFEAKALSMFRRAAALNPIEERYATALVELLEKLGRRREALEAAMVTACSAGADAQARTRLLERATALDDSAGTVLYAAQWHAGRGEVSRAQAALKSAAEKYEARPTEQLRVLERLVKLGGGSPGDATRAATLALQFRDTRRALTVLRSALEWTPDDRSIIQLAASALEDHGEMAAAALVYRELAYGYADAGNGERARAMWSAVLRLLPEDAEAKAILRAQPPAAPEPRRAELVVDAAPAVPPPLPSRAPKAPTSAKPVPPPLKPAGTLPEGFMASDGRLDLAATAEDIDRWAEALDLGFGAPASTPSPAPPPAPPTAAPMLQRSPGLAADAPALPAREAMAAAPTTALVVGDGPCAAWIARALADLGVEISSASEQRVDEALAGAHKPWDVVFAPPGLAEALTLSGRWLIISPIHGERSRTHSLARAASLKTLSPQVVHSGADVQKVAERWGGAVELVGGSGPGVPVKHPSAAHLAFARARARLPGEILAQRISDRRVRVLVASDGEHAIALGEWGTETVGGRELFRSPLDAAEGERRAVAAGAVLAQKQRGLAVVSLYEEDGAFVFESLVPSWDEGVLAVEVRLGTSVIAMQLGLARGESLLEVTSPRGVAYATRGDVKSLASLSNLRIEATAGGEAFIVSHASEGSEAARRLLRALAPPAAS